MFFQKLKKYTPQNIKNILLRIISFYSWKPHQVIIYSQGGEDLILEGILGNKKTGFWVDVGAHHPQRFSNTYLFYKRGWRGINIDALPGSMKSFKKLRPNDINLEIPIFKEHTKLTYYQFKEPALNGFESEIAIQRNSNPTNSIIRKIEMTGYPLRDVLKKHLPSNIQIIDFLTIDVEGLDLQVLESNDWTTYRPRVVVVEILDKPIYELENHLIVVFMKKNGYQLYSKSNQSAFFISNEYQVERETC